MNTTLKVILIVLGVLVVGTLVLGTGFFLGRFTMNRLAWMPMHSFGINRFDQSGDVWGHGMMGRFSGGRGNWDINGCEGGASFDMRGMMGGWERNGSCGLYGQGTGMMWEYESQTQASVEVLSVEQAEEAVHDYLLQYGDPDLVLAEVMIFDNHAYAEVIEKSTGIGAMELLVDPVSLAVYPEHGPNMMWNEKYGHMRGGMMGQSYRSNGASADMTVSENQAIQAAQAYLAEYAPGFQVDDHAAPFYGYYTLHTLQDGKIVGMLSVNGTSGDVFPHTWHGEFLEMVEFEEDVHE